MASFGEQTGGSPFGRTLPYHAGGPGGSAGLSGVLRNLPPGDVSGRIPGPQIVEKKALVFDPIFTSSGGFTASRPPAYYDLDSGSPLGRGPPPRRKRGDHLNLLEIQEITERYQAENGEIFALDHISFSMKEGEFLSIVGPSGCGKFSRNSHRP